MHIGEVARRTGVSLNTLRHYDEVDLLRPSGRSEGGFRLYAEDDVRRLLVIRRMKPLGFSLEQMRQVLEIVDALTSGASGDRRERLEQLAVFTALARQRRTELAAHLAMADELIGLLHDQGAQG